jgi:O-antigen/teichoic acid export membrane protein
MFNFGDYAGLRILMTLLAAMTICGISGVFYRGATAGTIVAFALSKSIESLSDILYGQWQQRERMDLISKSLMLRGFLGLAMVAISFSVFHKVWIAVCCMSAAWAVVLSSFDIPHTIVIARQMRQTITPNFSKDRMRKLFTLCIPLGGVIMLGSLISNVPRYMISHFRGERELGIFSALSYILIGGAMIVNALGQSATPRLAAYAANGTIIEFYRLLNRLLLIGLALGVSGILIALVAGRQIVTLIYGQAYAQSYELLPWLMVAAALSYLSSFNGYSITAARLFRIQVPLSILQTILTVALCYVCVQKRGMVGAAEALAGVSLVQLIGNAIVLRLHISKGQRTIHGST